MLSTVGVSVSAALVAEAASEAGTVAVKSTWMPARRAALAVEATEQPDTVRVIYKHS